MKSACKRLRAEAFNLASRPLPPERDDADGNADPKLIITADDECAEGGGKRMVKRKRKRQTEEEEEEKKSEKERPGEDLEIDRQLDQLLECKSKQHKLTSVNVRNIIHEVITNEHVVAMMKAAINETDAVPPFEPKMTRSKLKEVVEKGVAVPAWNISPIKTGRKVSKVHQFVDIPLAEEDSSDEEYRPDDEDEDETAEDTLLESDFESAASPPRGSRRHLRSGEKTTRAESASMGPPPPPKAPPPSAQTDNFLEKLHAVEAELAVCMDPYQPLEDTGEGGLMAYRTRSKRPLRDIPLGRLEAELRAPDITPDMYDCGSGHEDSNWTDWLRGLMTSDVDNDEECDDEDDPEYNFLADIDEPDQEDYRDDKAVRITKKEVNELMEELFETLKEDLTSQEVDDEGHEEEELPREGVHTHDKRVAGHACYTHKETCEGDVEVGQRPMPERRTVRQQLSFMRSTRHTASVHILRLDAQHRRTLAQQVQQHVQLLLQIHLLTSVVEELRHEAETTQQFLFELDLLARRGEPMTSPERRSAFRAANLQGALELLAELRDWPVAYAQLKRVPDARGQSQSPSPLCIFPSFVTRACLLPVRCFPVMPAELAWIFATSPVFLYPQLLPRVSLDPAHYCPRRTAAFTAAEDSLLIMGLRNLEGSRDPTRLLCDLLLGKSVVQVRRRIQQCCRPGVPDNIVKTFRCKRVIPRMLRACAHVAASERRPPVERDVRLMPLWLVRSLPAISKAVNSSGHVTALGSSSTCYPSRLPSNLHFRRVGFVQQAERTSSPLSSALPSPRAQNLPSPGCSAPTAAAAGMQRINEAESERPAFSESSRLCGMNVGVARMTQVAETFCHLPEEGEPRPQLEPHASVPEGSEPRKTANDAHMKQEAPPTVSAQNVSTGANGEKMVVWTREADRLILTACKQQGANWRTFRRVSAQLGTKSARQVSLRFKDLLHLFRVATTSVSRPSVVDQEPEPLPESKSSLLDS
ncbi:GON-4-like protein isoform X1 [Syngnathus typhle]|uniref:GON-4-like protein isoform X1 n=1 Tax=Syngnathus typhle TaxID=161592 RepID=UPI002A6B3111|nr:GON-4-like protein isoform X1 [Syngnathus typhle]